MDTPPPVRLNKNGHLQLQVTGMHGSGADEIRRLESRGYSLSSNARAVLSYEGMPSYADVTRTTAGRTYTVVLMRTATFREPTLRGVSYVARGFGYRKIPLSLMARLREILSDDDLRAMGLLYVVGVTAPCVPLISVRGMRNHVLGFHCKRTGNVLSAPPFGGRSIWDDKGAIALIAL